MLGCKVCCQNISTLTAQPDQGGWHWMRSVVVHFLRQFLAAALVSCCSCMCGTDHISQLCILSLKTNQRTQTLLFIFVVMMLVLNQFLPLALSLLKKVNKPARDQPGRILIAREGPTFEDTESSAVIRWACTEFCSMHKRLNFSYVSAGLFMIFFFYCQHA